MSNWESLLINLNIGESESWNKAVISSNNLSEDIVSQELSTESFEEAAIISAEIDTQGVNHSETTGNGKERSPYM